MIDWLATNSVLRLLVNNDGNCARGGGLGIRICPHQATIYFLLWSLTFDWDR